MKLRELLDIAKFGEDHIKISRKINEIKESFDDDYNFYNFSSLVESILCEEKEEFSILLISAANYIKRYEEKLSEGYSIEDKSAELIIRETTRKIGNAIYKLEENIKTFKNANKEKLSDAISYLIFECNQVAKKHNFTVRDFSFKNETFSETVKEKIEELGEIVL